MPISGSLARNVPSQSFVGPLRYCRSSVILCNALLWSFAVFSHTASFLLLKYSLHGFPGLLTVISEHMFSTFSFSVFTLLVVGSVR